MKLPSPLFAQGFDLSKFSQEKLTAARMMTDPVKKYTNKEIAKAVGVTDRTIYRWKEDPEFNELLVFLTLQYLRADLADTVRAMKKAIKKGKVNAMQLHFQAAGLLVDRRETVQDVNVTHTHNIETKSTEELMMEAKQLRKQLREKPIDITEDVEVVADEPETTP